MIKVAIVGQGNISFHLENAFSLTEEVDVIVIDSREEPMERLGNSFDICLIAVSDSAIKKVSEKLQGVNALVAHTSGSVALKELPAKLRRGVFYPLQTFSKEKEVDFSDVPICIEAENQNDIDVLLKLAGQISLKVQKVSSNQRKSLHLAAVFANNFTNHMYQIAYEICEESDLSFDLIKPLIVETSNKIQTLSPFNAQTGPARRNDMPTIGNHMKLLEDSGRKEIYAELSKSIKKTYGQKL